MFDDAKLIPLFKERAILRTVSLLTSFFLESFFSNERIISRVLSVEASFTIMSSSFLKYWFKTLSMDLPIYLWALYAGITIEINRLFFPICNGLIIPKSNTFLANGGMWYNLTNAEIIDCFGLCILDNFPKRFLRSGYNSNANPSSYS